MATSTLDSIIDVAPDSSPFYTTIDSLSQDDPSTQKINLHLIPQGRGSGLNADKVDGYNVSTATHPTPNTLCPLDKSGLFPLATIPPSGGAVAATTTTLGVVEMSVAPVVASTPIAVGDNDVRMTNSRAPTGTAGGDLGGTYPNPTVVNINGVQLGLCTATLGNILVADGSKWVSRSPIIGETPSGIINGINTSFTLAHSFFSQLKVFSDGIRTTDYIASGTSLTFNAGSSNIPTNSLIVDYVY